MAITDPEIEAYAVRHTTPEPPWFASLADNTRAKTDAPGMMVGTLEGRFLSFLVHLAQPRLVLEIGTFTGYSALSMAEALPEGGRIVTCDVSADHVRLAREHVAATPYADRIEFRVGPAMDTLATLDGPFDLVFVDADKTGYDAYLEAVLPKLSPHGVVVVDNVLWRGRVLDDSLDDPDTAALRAFNAKWARDPRVECVLLPIRDGVTLVRHRRAAATPGATSG